MKRMIILVDYGALAVSEGPHPDSFYYILK